MDSLYGFPLFPKLPPELRRIIWRFCLPRRVCELDEPFLVYEGAPDWRSSIDRFVLSCELRICAEQNARPPVITRICRESRAVAFEQGRLFKATFPPSAAHPFDLEVWFDPSTDILHSNYFEDEMVSSQRDDGKPLRLLASYAKRFGVQASVIANCFFWPPPGQIQALKMLSNWVVVVRMIVVHCDHTIALQSGLFGLLGDARTQLVDIDDQARLAAFIDLVRTCELGLKETPPWGFDYPPYIVPQEFTQETANTMRKNLEHRVVHGYKGRLSNELPPVRPVIMFRHCNLECNVKGSKTKLQAINNRGTRLHYNRSDRDPRIFLYL